MIKLVIFDWDGTLIDSAEQIVVTMQQAFMEAGLTEIPKPEQIKRIIGLSLDLAVTRLLPAEKTSVISQVVQCYKHLFRQKSHKESREPLIKSRIALAYRRVLNQGGLLQECLDLSK